MNIGVYGLGRFGYFWSGVLSRHFQVQAYSRSSDRAAPETVMRVAHEEEILSCDVLFLCVAISAMREVLERIAPSLKPGTLVIDTCSVKVMPVRLMRYVLPESVSILGTHPMFGPDSGKAGIRGLPIVLCRVRSEEEQFRFWKQMFQDFGLQVLEKTPEEHDREAAYTQGVTHFVGRVLGELRLSASPMATLGYRKLLDIIEQTCNDPMQLFMDLQRYNPYTRDMRYDLQGAIRNVLEKLEGISIDSATADRYDEGRNV